jgi:citrate lyase beta subunit
MVCVDYQNLEQLRKEAAEGAAMGFHGKQVIHPNQIQPTIEAFKPRKVHIPVLRIDEHTHTHKHKHAESEKDPFQCFTRNWWILLKE